MALLMATFYNLYYFIFLIILFLSYFDTDSIHLAFKIDDMHLESCYVSIFMFMYKKRESYRLLIDKKKNLQSFKCLVQWNSSISEEIDKNHKRWKTKFHSNTSHRNFINRKQIHYVLSFSIFLQITSELLILTHSFFICLFFKFSNWTKNQFEMMIFAWIIKQRANSSERRKNVWTLNWDSANRRIAAKFQRMLNSQTCCIVINLFYDYFGFWTWKDCLLELMDFDSPNLNELQNVFLIRFQALIQITTAIKWSRYNSLCIRYAPSLNRKSSVSINLFDWNTLWHSLRIN